MAKADHSQDEKKPHIGISADLAHERAPEAEAETLAPEEDEHASDFRTEDHESPGGIAPDAAKTPESDALDASDTENPEDANAANADETIPDDHDRHEQTSSATDARSAPLNDDDNDESALAETSARLVIEADDAAPVGADGSESPPFNETQTIVTETVIQRRGGFLPIFFGGILAAGIGFFAGQYPNGWPFAMQTPDTFRSDIIQRLDAQASQLASRKMVVDQALDEAATARIAVKDLVATNTDRLDGIFAQITELESANADAFADLTAKIAENTGAVLDISEQTTALLTETETSNLRITALSDQLAELQTRLAALEKRPVVDAISPEAIAAYEREIDRLREDVTAQRAEIASLAQEAVAAEQSASTLAAEAAAQAALADLLSALQNGRPYDAQLQRLADAGLVLPAGLTASAVQGVSTQASLIDLFPDAARAALSAARAEDSAEAEDRSLGAILRRQFSVRSLTPQTGTTTDAILSRAEDALRRGDLTTVLTELDDLSPAATAALAELRDLISARHTAFAAATAIGHDLK